MKTRLFKLPHNNIIVALTLALMWLPSLHAATTEKYGGTLGATNISWTCPATVTSLRVECWGAGGGGGAAQATAAVSVGGGGGAAGCYAVRTNIPVTPGNTYTILIPERVQNTNFTAGFRTNGPAISFTGDSGVTVTAAGGQGGESWVTNAAFTGAGGVASTNGCVGDLFYIGGNGGSATTLGRGGMGGSAPSDLAPGTNAVANPANSSTQNTGAAGSDAFHTGANGAAGRTTAAVGNIGGSQCGGGGGAMVSSIATQIGGVGGRGQILLTYTVASSNVKTNNIDDLNLASSWTVGVPSSTGVAKWNNTVTSANTVSLGANLTFGGINISNPVGTVTINVGNTLTLGSETTDIDMTSATVDLVLNCSLALGGPNVWDVQTGRTLTLGGIVSGSQPVTKQGAGTVILSAANTYSGATTVSAGTLKLAASEVLPNGGTGGNVTVDGTLDLNGNSETINGFLGAGTVDNTSATPVTFAFGDNAQNTVFSGTITNTSGTITVNKVGNPSATVFSSAGATRLMGTNGYSGDTVIINGNLRAGVPGCIPNGSGKGNVVLNPVVGLAMLDIFSTNGPVVINGLTNSGGGTSYVGNTTTGTTNTLTIGSNDATSTFSGLFTNVTGSGLNLVKVGNGTLNLTGTVNLHNGNTTVSGGTLALTLAGLNTNSTVSVASGAALQLNFAETNLVAAFVTNGVSLPAGVYKAANAAPFITGTGSLEIAATVSPASSNAFLTSLVLSPAGALTPAFASNVLAYGASEAYGNAPTVTVTNADLTATNELIYNGTTNTLASGSASAPLTLTLGVTNSIKVRVTAQDGLTVNTYVLDVVMQPSLTAPALSKTLSGGTLTLSWPADHLGYTLQEQTNSRSLGLSTNWVAVPGSASVTSTNIPIDPTKPTVFYRLVYP